MLISQDPYTVLHVAPKAPAEVAKAAHAALKAVEGADVEKLDKALMILMDDGACFRIVQILMDRLASSFGCQGGKEEGRWFRQGVQWWQ